MSDDVGNKNFSKLTSAAEELIKAASAHVETTSIAIGQETVEVLKKISHGSTSIESKLNTLNQNVSSLETKTHGKLAEISTQMILYLDKVNQSIFLQMKHQRLDWAFANADYGSFDFVDRSENYCNYKPSTVIVKAITSMFRKDSGRYITNLAKYRTDAGKDEKAEFRAAIVEQLFALLGTKPRLECKEEKWIIWYE